MTRIPKFDEETARRLYEIYHGTKKDKAAALAKFYGIEEIAGLDKGAYRSHGDIVSLIGNIAEERQRSLLISVIGTNYDGIEFEPRAYRKNGSTDKKLFYFNDSLDRIKKANYERHARSQEVFGLVIDGLEGKLANTPLQGVYGDMFKSYSEFMSLAWECKGNMLIAYLDPEGLVWNAKTDCYVKKGFKFTEQEEFNIVGKDSDQWIDLKEFDDEFVEWHYTRKFSELPKKMQKGDKRAQVYLPLDGSIWPVGRGSYGDGFDIFSYFSSRASRGVRKNFP